MSKIQYHQATDYWNFYILKIGLEEFLNFFPCVYLEKTKALIFFAVTAKLICAFVFAYAKCWFSHYTAQIIYYVWDFLAHLSQRLIGELIGCSWSGVRPSSLTISNIFFSNTACPIKAKFYAEPPWVGETTVCSRHLGHMNKMAATPIYGKTL